MINSSIHTFHSVDVLVNTIKVEKFIINFANQLKIVFVKYLLYALIGSLCVMFSPILYIVFVWLMADLRKKIREIMQEIPTSDTDLLINIEQKLNSTIVTNSLASLKDKVKNSPAILLPIQLPLLSVSSAVIDLHQAVKNQIDEDINIMSEGWDDHIPEGVVSKEMLDIWN